MISVRLISRALVFAVVATGPAWAVEPQLQSMCAQMAAWTPKQIQDLKDPDLEKFTCISAKATLRAATTQDKTAEANCQAGVRKLIEEFKRRWPKREPDEVIGKC